MVLCLWIEGRHLSRPKAVAAPRIPLAEKKGTSPSVHEELVRLQREKGLSLATIWKNKLFTVDFAARELNGRGAFITRGTAVKGALSPDGSEIAFSYCPDPGLLGVPPGELPPRSVECAIPEYLGIIRADGTGLREYRNLRYPTGFCWSLQDSRLVMSVEDVEDNPPADDALHVLDLVSGIVRRLGNESFAYVSSQCQSPDGNAIVYTLNKPGIQIIRVFDLKRETTKDIAAGPSGYEATWAPSGQWITFLVHALRPSSGKRDEYYRIRPSGEEKQVVVRGDLLNGPLMWSPDSRFVAYTGYASGSDAQHLWVRRLEDNSEDWFATLSESDPGLFQWVQNPDLLKR